MLDSPKRRLVLGQATAPKGPSIVGQASAPNGHNTVGQAPAPNGPNIASFVDNHLSPRRASICGAGKLNKKIAKVNDMYLQTSNSNTNSPQVSPRHKAIIRIFNSNPDIKKSPASSRKRLNGNVKAGNSCQEPDGKQEFYLNPNSPGCLNPYRYDQRNKITFGAQKRDTKCATESPLKINNTNNGNLFCFNDLSKNSGASPTHCDKLSNLSNVSGNDTQRKLIIRNVNAPRSPKIFVNKNISGNNLEFDELFDMHYSDVQQQANSDKLDDNSNLDQQSSICEEASGSTSYKADSVYDSSMASNDWNSENSTENSSQNSSENPALSWNSSDHNSSNLLSSDHNMSVDSKSLSERLALRSESALDSTRGDSIGRGLDSTRGDSIALGLDSTRGDSIANGLDSQPLDSSRADSSLDRSSGSPGRRKIASLLRPRTSSLGSWPLRPRPRSSDRSSRGLEDPACSSNDSGMVESFSSKMVLIKCKDGNYLTRIFIGDEGIEGVKVVGRVGAGPSAPMSATASPRHLPKGGGMGSPLPEGEFEHDTADYQWLLDYEYRESYTRDSLGEHPPRVSVLSHNYDSNMHDMSYETLSRNLDANLAEIEMDDFRSDDIHQLLTLPSDDEEKCSDADNSNCFVAAEDTPTRTHKLKFKNFLRQKLLNGDQSLEGSSLTQGYEDYELEEEELSGVSGEMSLYQSGPLFSPLKEPPPLGNTTFSVDSLDCESLHEDLILTCQANKDNYTIAFEGSYIQYSDESDYHETGDSDTTGTSGSWLEDGAPPTMTHSDQPYTTWSRVSRKTCHTPDLLKSRPPQSSSPSARQQYIKQQRLAMLQHQQNQLQHNLLQADGNNTSAPAAANASASSKCSSMPNLMRRSFMRQSLDTGGTQCIKIFDLQNSLKCSQPIGRPGDGNSFSLVRLFMKQKSLSKEAISLSSSCTSRSHEEACSSSENHSGVDSSDWQMNSQSDDGSAASPLPPVTLRHHSLERNYRRSSNLEEFQGIVDTQQLPQSVADTDAYLVNNNNMVNNLLDNTGNMIGCDNIASFDDSIKETCVCSKPPVTSPIREEPEGMDISFDSRCESKQLSDQSETEIKTQSSISSNINRNSSTNDAVNSPAKHSVRTSSNRTSQNIQSEEKWQSQSPITPRKASKAEAGVRHRQDSGNSTSGYASTKGSTDKISQRTIESNSGPKPTPRPRNKPRAFKQVVDQCLQTSNLKVSATMNTSGLIDRNDIYVYYPNYALPDLSFLKGKKYNVDSRIFLVPQHYNKSPLDMKKMRDSRSKRPFSSNDFEKLKKRGTSHVKDWESLNALLPKEVKDMLSGTASCTTKKSPKRTSSCEFNNQRKSSETKGSNSSLSTDPSSGFRGSSTILNDSDIISPHETDSAFSRTTKRSISLSNYDEADASVRPPLPRGILRKTTSLKDENKQAASKRLSATEFSLNLRDDSHKRRSLREPMEALTKRSFKAIIPEAAENSSVAPEMNCSCMNNCTGFCGHGLKKKNLLRVSELPDVSSHEEFSDQDLAALRSQVSNFLVGKTLDEDLVCELCRKNGESSNGSGCKHMRRLMEVTQGSQQQVENPTLPSRPPSTDAPDHRVLISSVRAAVERLVRLLSRGRDGPASASTAAQLTLDKLCPALFALLSDGLLPCLTSLFGRLSNSVWRVVEATSHMGPSTKALNDLVLTLNSEDCLTEGPMKFNAFVFGLLNIRSLDSWLGYLRTRESVLQKHYSPHAFLYLANTATRNLYDDMLMALRPLSLLPLHLDLLFEYKLLHASLLKMEERMMLHSSSNSSPGERPASSLLDRPASTLIDRPKSAILDRPTSALLDQLLDAKETKEFKNTAAAQQDKVKALMKVLSCAEASESELLETVANTVSCDGCKSPRPRSSCYDNSLSQELHPSLRKRWSNVQFGSRLITAIDKLMSEDTDVAGGSHDHTDDMDGSNLSSKYDDISERSASDKDVENEKGPKHPPTSLAGSRSQESEGDKFRRLQMKWERMAGHDMSSSKETDEAKTGRHSEDFCSSTATETMSEPSREKVLSPTSGIRSKIPRPVSMTSPQKPFKAFEPVKENTSPALKPQRQVGFTAVKDAYKAAPPRRSLKDKSYSLVQDTPASVKSRLLQKAPLESASSSRASSMPGRGEPSGQAHRFVQTLHHRLATDNGHLSFSRGEVLTLVVEVDQRYLLCCLNQRKGLVPRASVIPAGDK